MEKNDAAQDPNSAQRQSPNQEIANDANRNTQADKVDDGSGTTARVDNGPTQD